MEWERMLIGMGLSFSIIWFHKLGFVSYNVKENLERCRCATVLLLTEQKLNLLFDYDSVRM